MDSQVFDPKASSLSPIDLIPPEDGEDADVDVQWLEYCRVAKALDRTRILEVVLSDLDADDSPLYEFIDDAIANPHEPGRRLGQSLLNRSPRPSMTRSTCAWRCRRYPMTSDSTTSEALPEAMEHAMMAGNLADLRTERRADYYNAVCRSLGLNPLTKPFEFLTLNRKLWLYVLRGCTGQLRRLHGISIYITNRERMGDIYIVTARAKDHAGREDGSTGAVPLGNLKGDASANALMKSETKAKRRVTLSIAALGWLDETELDTISQYDLATSNPQPLPGGEEMFQSSVVAHPTADEITTLVDTAWATNVSLEDFGHDMRRLMQVPEGQKVTKKFLRETMTMEQYNMARSHYRAALRQILEEDVPNHEPPAETREPTDPRLYQHPLNARRVRQPLSGHRLHPPRPTEHGSALKVRRGRCV
jgi:hypothetical protein